MSAIMTTIATTYVQTYSTPGTYAVTIPMNYGVVASLWGAGGSGTGFSPSPAHNWYAGGSGAHVSCHVNAVQGSTIYLVVGQGGQPGAYSGTTSSAIGGGGTVQGLQWLSINIRMMDNFIHHMYRQRSR